MEKITSAKNEIRVTKVKSLTSYLTYIYHVFNDEPKFEFVTINAIGNAIAKAVSLAELCRLRIAGLYTVSEINFVELPDGDQKKRVTGIKITLSKKKLDTSAPGYMEPLPLSKVEEYQVYPTKTDGDEKSERRPRGSRRYRRRGRRDGDYEREDHGDDEREYRRRGRRPRRGGREYRPRGDRDDK